MNIKAIIKSGVVATIVLLAYSGAEAQQDTVAMRFAKTITAEDLKEDLLILASDSLEGRETGEKGQKMAADYISRHFREAGLLPVVPQGQGNSYLQPFNLKVSSWDEVVITAGSTPHKMFDGFFLAGAPEEPINIEKQKILFLGYGQKEEYEKLEIKGNSVLLFRRPGLEKEAATKELESKVNLAKENGAAAIFVVYAQEDEDFNKTMGRYRHYLERPSYTLMSNAESKKKMSSEIPVFYVSNQLAGQILGVSERRYDRLVKKLEKKNGRSGKEIQSKIGYKLKKEIRTITSENVLGLVPGTDLQNEVLVLTAHYDHLGIHDGEVFNGADDDGSGTVAVMEIAEAFAKAYRSGNGPRRSVLFMAVAGEEKGLLGSSYYVENPIFPIENTVANLNIDMIGREDKEHEGDPDYIYLIGSDKLSTELHELSEKANEQYTKLDLDYKFNAEDDPNRFYYRSDHYNFAKKGVPVIFYFNGVHDDYHKSTDTIDKIDFDKITNITKLVFYTAWEIANRPNRPAVDKTTK